MLPLPVAAHGVKERAYPQLLLLFTTFKLIPQIVFAFLIHPLLNRRISFCIAQVRPRIHILKVNLLHQRCNSGSTAPEIQSREYCTRDTIKGVLPEVQ